MAKKVNGKRFIITLSVERYARLTEMMAWDVKTNRSAAIGDYIVELHARRKVEKEKRPVGRPKKEGKEDDGDWEKEPKIFDHPDTFMNAGRKIGRTELITYYKMRNETIPPEVQKLLDENE